MPDESNAVKPDTENQAVAAAPVSPVPGADSATAANPSPDDQASGDSASSQKGKTSNDRIRELVRQRNEALAKANTGKTPDIEGYSPEEVKTFTDLAAKAGYARKADIEAERATETQLLNELSSLEKKFPDFDRDVILREGEKMKVYDPEIVYYTLKGKGMLQPPEAKPAPTVESPGTTANVSGQGTAEKPASIRDGSLRDRLEAKIAAR